MSSKQVYTLIVEDKPIVAKVTSTRTIVDTIVVGTSSATVNVDAAPAQPETVQVGTGNHPIGLVVDNETIVEKVIIGTPISNVQAKYYDINGLEDLIAEIVDSDYINSRKDCCIDSEATMNLIDSAYIQARVDTGIDSDAIFQLIDSDYIQERSFSGKLVWVTSGDNQELRINTGFRDEPNAIVQLVREARFNQDTLLELELATFTPSLQANGQLNLNWDQPATQWTISVTNPDDFTSQYVDDIGNNLTNRTAGVTALVADYTTTGPSQLPDGGVDWNQTFLTNQTARILSTTNNLTGGNASATVTFLDNNNNTIATDDINYTWKNANVAIQFANLSGKTFLEEYNTVNYTVSITGLSNLSNASSVVTPSGGSISNTTGSGTFTFDVPLNKNNNNNSRSVSVNTDFTRPAGVSTFDSYIAVDSDIDRIISVDYTFPSFWLFTSFVGNPPASSDIISGTAFKPEVNLLADESNVVDTFINNSETVPQAFWLGVRSSSTQPTNFQTGISAALLSDVVVTTGYTVNLQPDAPPSGFVAEEYTLYGITLQPGNTYVRIN